MRKKYAYGGTPIHLKTPEEMTNDMRLKMFKKEYDAQKAAKKYEQWGTALTALGNIAVGAGSGSYGNIFGGGGASSSGSIGNAISSFGFGNNNMNANMFNQNVPQASMSAGASKYTMPAMNDFKLTNSYNGSLTNLNNYNFGGNMRQPNFNSFAMGGPVKPPKKKIRPGTVIYRDQTDDEYKAGQASLLRASNEGTGLGFDKDNALFQQDRDAKVFDSVVPYDNYKKGAAFSDHYVAVPSERRTGYMVVVPYADKNLYVKSKRNYVDNLMRDFRMNNPDANFIIDDDFSYEEALQRYPNGYQREKKGFGGNIGNYVNLAGDVFGAISPLLMNNDTEQDPFDSRTMADLNSPYRFANGGDVERKRFLDTFNSNGYDYLKKHGPNTMPHKKSTFQRFTESQNPFAALIGKFATGGEVPIEAEGQEIVEEPNGNMYELQGASHEQGGIDMSVPEGSQIYSKRLKGVDGRNMAERKKFREQHLAKLEKLLQLNPNDRLLRKTYEKTVRDFKKQEQEDMAYMNYMNQQQQMAQQQAMRQQQMAQAMQQSAYDEGMEEGYQEGYGQGENMGYSEAYEEQPQFATGGYVNPYENRNPFF